MKQKYISQSPYLTAGLTRAELFNPKKKRDTMFDGIGKDYSRIQKKKKPKPKRKVKYVKQGISLKSNNEYWRFS